MPKIVMVDSQLAKEAEKILDVFGLDIDVAVKVLLKRIVREQNIAFLTAPHTSIKEEETQLSLEKRESSPKTSVSEIRMQDDGRMTKNLAVSLFRAQGVRINRNVTFASKNRSAYNYWANPNFAVLEDEWFLILNDWTRKELHLLCIPSKAISPAELVYRSDLPDKIDLQICYNDPTYTDNRSKVSFGKYLLKKITY